MHASAHLTIARTNGGARSRITRLHSDPPFVLRPTRPVGVEPMQHWFLCDTSPARVSLVAGAAGPVGGDRLCLSIDVESRASLVLREVAATLVLPGPHNQPSRTEITVRVAADAVFVWLPEPVIAAQNCQHQAVTHITLEPGARLILREELLLGRHAEQPGAVRQRLRVCRDNQPMYDQELAVGPGAVGWNGPAAIGGRRAVGSVLVVDPGWDHTRADLAPTPAGADTALLRLGESAVLVTALAKDGLALRRHLDTGIATVEAAMLHTHANASECSSSCVEHH